MRDDVETKWLSALIGTLLGAAIFWLAVLYVLSL
jgi:hypothetical protein